MKTPTCTNKRDQINEATPTERLLTKARLETSVTFSKRKKIGTTMIIERGKVSIPYREEDSPRKL